MNLVKRFLLSYASGESMKHFQKNFINERILWIYSKDGKINPAHSKEMGHTNDSIFSARWCSDPCSLIFPCKTSLWTERS